MVGKTLNNVFICSFLLILKVLFVENAKVKTSVLATFATALTTISNKIQTAEKKSQDKEKLYKKA